MRDDRRPGPLRVLVLFSRAARPGRWLAPIAGLLVVAACDGPQSAVDPQGPRARELVELWWILAAGAVVIWTLVIGFAVYATRVRPGAHPGFRGTALIVGGGVGLPVIAFTIIRSTPGSPPSRSTALRSRTCRCVAGRNQRAARLPTACRSVVTGRQHRS